MASIEEEIKTYNWNVQQFEKLGYKHYDAITAVDNNIDYHYIENLLKKGCPSQVALDIASP